MLHFLGSIIVQVAVSSMPSVLKPLMLNILHRFRGLSIDAVRASPHPTRDDAEWLVFPGLFKVEGTSLSLIFSLFDEIHPCISRRCISNPGKNPAVV